MLASYSSLSDSKSKVTDGYSVPSDLKPNNLIKDLAAFVEYTFSQSSLIFSRKLSGIVPFFSPSDSHSVYLSESIMLACSFAILTGSVTSISIFHEISLSPQIFISHVWDTGSPLHLPLAKILFSSLSTTFQST